MHVFGEREREEGEGYEGRRGREIVWDKFNNVCHYANL